MRLKFHQINFILGAGGSGERRSDGGTLSGVGANFGGNQRDLRLRKCDLEVREDYSFKGGS